MLADNLKIVQEKIEASLQKRKEAMQTGDAVTLVAVTKNHAPEVITEALSLGENASVKTVCRKQNTKRKFYLQVVSGI